ncbi:MAG: DUF998 domain-containing protein [Candidatus Lokiarchaeota archaeon]|nr:DUF998 domain-containing protein [Candidatus Lokiarchaeota archaeon]MBD3341014.1 DUF998 domain-containing protein [Candidatus Lokiarchaeota archaeon]
MEKNPLKWPLVVLAGIMIWITDIFFNLNAILLWPNGNFSPFENYHSDLGRTIPGPRGHNSELGAQFYNCGQVFQGVTVIFFAIGLSIAYTEEKRIRIILILGQIFGILVGIALIMNGIYSEDFQPYHGQWSEVIFISIMSTELLSNYALLKNPSFRKKIAYFGFVAGFINLFFLIVFIGNIPILTYFIEYLAIYGAEIWVALVAINAFKNEVSIE